MFDVQRFAFAAAEHRARHDAWPSLDQLRMADATLPRVDPWKHPFRIDDGGNSLTVRSAGVDGTFDTGDDVISDPMRAPVSAATTAGGTPHR